MIIALDFDGTCVTHEFPNVGRDIGAQSVLHQLVAKGHQLILYTMRSGKTLAEAKSWFRHNGIELWAVNENPEQKEWTDSPKVYANLYIDDAALGAPLVYHVSEGERPYLDWEIVEQYLKDGEIL